MGQSLVFFGGGALFVAYVGVDVDVDADADVDVEAFDYSNQAIKLSQDSHRCAEVMRSLSAKPTSACDPTISRDVQST